MKSLLSILLILSVVAMSLAGGHKKRKSHKSHSRKLNKLSPNNVYYKFSVGLTEQLGGNPKDIEGCLAADWKSEASTDTKTSLPAFEGMGAVLKKVHEFLGESIESSCKFHNDVKDFFKKKLGVRRHRRVFTQVKKHHKGPFDDIVPLTKELHLKTKELLSSPLVVKSLSLIKCLKETKTAVAGLITTVTNYINNQDKMISNLSGFIDILVESACRWHEMRDAIKFLKEGLETVDNLAKWFAFGQFLGKFIKTVGV